MRIGRATERSSRRSSYRCAAANVRIVNPHADEGKIERAAGRPKDLEVLAGLKSLLDRQRTDAGR